jgi:hypothetical protein
MLRPDRAEDRSSPGNGKGFQSLDSMGERIEIGVGPDYHSIASPAAVRYRMRLATDSPVNFPQHSA